MIPDSVKEGWEIKEKDEGVRFRTFHVVIDHETPMLGVVEQENVSTVTAVTVPMNDELTEFKVQFSYLSPKEERGFCRQTAKDIALARLNSKVAIGVKLTDNRKLKDALKSVIVLQANKKGIHWLEGAKEENLV